MSRYVKSFDETKCISIFIKDDEFLKTITKSEMKSAIVKNMFHSKLIYIKNYLRAKVKSYDNGTRNAGSYCF